MAGDAVQTSFGNLNYSGMLFNKGNTRAPFSSIIGGKTKQTNHVEFVTGQEYTTGTGSQPAISETASLTAPDAQMITRAQKTNVTQIFMKALKISYAKMSNMGTLSGVNIAGQTPNPVSEWDFQVAAVMAELQQDIEYTCINGVYVKAANDATANKTRGILPAITTNAIDADGKALDMWLLADAMKLVYDSNAPLSSLIAWVDAVAKFQLAAWAKDNGFTIQAGALDIAGIKVDRVLTPLGEISLYLGEYLPAGTVMLWNPDVVAPVEQPVPGKGNFFMEELAKTGAGEKSQIYGQLGLDHGPEWHHAKITNLSTAFEKPKSGMRFYIKDAIPTAEVLPVLDEVALASAKVGTATGALTLGYIGTPAAAVTLAYKWQIAATEQGSYADIADATSATYTPAAGDVNKYVRAVVTASGTAAGTVASNPVKVAAA